MSESASLTNDSTCVTLSLSSYSIDFTRYHHIIDVETEIHPNGAITIVMTPIRSDACSSVDDSLKLKDEMMSDEMKMKVSMEVAIACPMVMPMKMSMSQRMDCLSFNYPSMLVRPCSLRSILIDDSRREKSRTNDSKPELEEIFQSHTMTSPSMSPQSQSYISHGQPQFRHHSKPMDGREDDPINKANDDSPSIPYDPLPSANSIQSATLSPSTSKEFTQLPPLLTIDTEEDLALRLNDSTQAETENSADSTHSKKKWWKKKRIMVGTNNKHTRVRMLLTMRFY